MMEGTQVKFDHLQSRTDRLYTPRRDRRPNGSKESREPGSSVPLHRKDQSWSRDSINEPKREPAVPLAWCETPRLIKKDPSLRRRLLVSRSSSDGNKSVSATPGDISRVHHESFDSPDVSPTGPLSYSTLKADDFFSCRKRRLLFSQAVTSTLDTGRSGVHMSPAAFQNQAVEPDLDESIIAGLPSSPQTGDFTPLSGDAFRSPLRAEKHVPDTSPLTPASEDSGFSSLGLDKSHDSSVDHDGSFQELVLPTSSSKDKRCSRLDRQRRLSTLREGGSQSEDRPRDRQTGCGELRGKDDVFLDGTPLSAATLKMRDLSLTPALQAVHAISRRGARALQQQTSLEDLLRVSEEDGPVGTSLPLSGLIGRKMGLDKVDVISELRMRNLRHVLAVIMSLLSAADLYRFGQVSEDWNDVISEDKRAAHRRRSHIRELKIALEGDRPAHVPDADTRSALACRSVLGSVQAQARTPHAHQPCTPTQSNERHCSSKRMQFLQVAKTLFSDEYLKPCPRCQHPARCHALRGEGLCSWSDCLFRFCTACSSAFHGSKDCAHLSAKRRSKRDVLPGSAQSKRNEQSLSSDQTFTEFFNDFLLLPVFSVAVRFDGISAGFELLDHTSVHLSHRIRAALHEIRSRTLSDPSWIPAEPVQDNSYTVTCLDREQTIQWLKRERLMFFLQSDCYFEFRLAKCLCQLSGPVCGTANGGARRRFLDFKRSLVGGPGENILHLWMDIERLNTLSSKTKSRYLEWMKGQYVISSSAEALGEQLLSRLGLNSTTCWREERLRDVQPCLSEILLLYWGHRFHLFPSNQWQICEQVLSSSVCTELCISYLPLCTSASVCADTEAQPVELDSSEIQTLLEVLHTESRSGFVFTHFCQNSGQQLWENAVYFCSELLQYHQLFSQSSFDPYRAQRMAQLLYASYLSSGAQMSVGLNEEDRRDVLQRLSPPFEDLFDRAEEHALSVLLEPWTLLSERLRDPLHTVAQWQEVRYAEAELFQTLQTLYAHTQSRPQQQERRTAPAEGSRAPDLWAKVPREYRGLRLDSLLRNRMELQHFLSFLEENSASLELQCWLDVEQLKKSDGALQDERNTRIKDKYLSSNFLFGPGSPATEEQRMRLLQMCGGWQRLQCESVSLSVLAELQSLLHNRLETRWLPLFLSSSQFITRQQQKMSGGLMSSSQESVSLRRALSNPVTRLQFQKFLSVRDDLLENDLLFWLEVQRYKDLCHSRCDDVSLQRKVSIIISCFISSSVPPALQIHVPPEAAQRLVSQQRALGPYVFRETQACVFDELLKHWPDFVALRSAVGEDELQRVLDRERRSRPTEEQDHSGFLQEDDEAHSAADEEQSCRTDGTRVSTYKKAMLACEALCLCDASVIFSSSVGLFYAPSSAPSAVLIFACILMNDLRGWRSHEGFTAGATGPSARHYKVQKEQKHLSDGCGTRTSHHCRSYH
ncbi:hypothetical protein QQF64_009079 [Cirrhinus molitorella]|uniref:Regulator of G-protein signaling 22 n=1 Tax=Cirrhinus molitorella TaxID=172907 RepID=A0ABR3M055_9TELE